MNRSPGARAPNAIPRFKAARAIAWYLGEDERDVERDRRYQPTRTPCPVYTNGDEYLAASPGKRKPREVDDNFMGRWEWEQVDARLPDGFPWTIWRAKEGR